MHWGPYILGEELHGGSAYAVLDAQDTVRERPVALMRPRSGRSLAAAEGDQFLREGEALAAVRHSHIVEILDYGEIEGWPFLALAPVEGPTLAERIRSETRPEARPLCTALADIADGVHALHQAGVHLGTVPPTSISLPLTGGALLFDFGLACPLYRTLRKREPKILGKPLWMAPEQLLGGPNSAGAATDVHALGYTLHQGLTGQPPFKTDNLQKLMRLFLQKKPRPVHKIDRTIPRPISDVVSRCLEKDLRKRYATAAELAEVLRAAAG